MSVEVLCSQAAGARSAMGQKLYTMHKGVTAHGQKTTGKLAAVTMQLTCSLVMCTAPSMWACIVWLV